MHLLSFILATFLASVTSAQSLVELVQSQPDLSTLLSALQGVPVFTQNLAEARDVTILAPTNDAFAKILPDSPVGQVLAQLGQTPPGQLAPEPIRANVRALLAYHVLKGSYPASAAMQKPAFVPSLLDETFQVDGQPVARVTGGQNVGIVATGSGGVEISSGGLTKSQVVQADIQAPNNVIIHKIDTVLSLPQNVTTTGISSGNTAAVDALAQTGLDETLDTATDLTVFIPSNQAFEAAQQAIAGADQQTLADVLSYHAIVGNVKFSSELCNTKLKTVQGSDVTIRVGQNGSITVDNARVITPDIILSNGVGHVIDAVLMPGQGGQM